MKDKSLILEELCLTLLTNPDNISNIIINDLIYEYNNDRLDMHNNQNALYRLMQRASDLSTYDRFMNDKDSLKFIVDTLSKPQHEAREILHKLVFGDRKVLKDTILSSGNARITTGDIQLDTQLDSMKMFFDGKKIQIFESTMLPAFSSQMEKWEKEQHKKDVDIYESNVGTLIKAYKKRFIIK